LADRFSLDDLGGALVSGGGLVAVFERSISTDTAIEAWQFLILSRSDNTLAYCQELYQQGEKMEKWAD
jgi:hypothetical protein